MKAGDLFDHRSGCAGEHHPAVDELVDRCVQDVCDGGTQCRATCLRREHRGAQRRRLVTGWVQELGCHLVVLQVPLQLTRASLCLCIIFAHEHQTEVRELLLHHWRKPLFEATLPIRLEHLPCAVMTVEDDGEVEAAIRRFDHRRCALCRDPHWRMRLLVHPRPHVHLPGVKVVALPVERAVDRSPRLHDEVDRLPEPLLHQHRVHVRRGDLLRHPTHEAHLDATARDHVAHRHLLGDADRLLTVRDRIAEDQQPGVLRLASEYGQRERCTRVDTRRGGVMLVHHHVEPGGVGGAVEIEVPLVELCATHRIEHTRRQRDAHGFELTVRREVGIRHLGEEPRAKGHASPSATSRWISSMMARGHSSSTRCAASATRTTRAGGTNAFAYAV